MLKTLLTEALIAPQLPCLPARSLAYGIKKDRFGYPVLQRDQETEEPRETLKGAIRKAPPRVRAASGHDVRTHHSLLVYKQYLEEDRRNIQQLFRGDYENFSGVVEQVVFEQGMKRTGLIARKHGETKTCRRTGEIVTSTLLEIQDNYVMACNPIIYNGSTNFVKMKLGAFDAPNIEDVPLVKQKEFLSIGLPPKEVEHEFIITPEQALPVNYKLDISHFFVGQYLDISGITINRGFQGVIRRWGYKGQGEFGRSKTHRRPGSISTQGLARVLRGKKMPGIMGGRPHVTHNAQILYANYESRYLIVEGPVQGVVGCFVYLSDSEKKDPVQGPLLHYPTFLGSRTDLGAEIYDRSVVDPSERFEEVYERRIDKQLL